MDVSPNTAVRIAILGGGIAGATAAIALGKLADVKIEVFDQARELREIGASIALQPCALRCLEKLGLGEEVERLAYRHGEHPLVHRHWRTSEVIETPLPNPLPIRSHQMARFYRVHLHQLLVSHIPPDRIHLNKRVANVRCGECSRGVIVDFEDGTRWEGDAVVGADGIRSRTRSCFYPDYEISAGELVTLRQVFAASKLEGLDGIPKESCHWPGPDRQLFTSPLKGDLFSIVAFLPTHLLRSPEPRDNSTRSWGQTGSTAELAGYYADWHPSIAALARVTPSINVYPDYHGPALPSLVVGDGRVVLIGDAGHPHGGAFAAGGTLSIEDAYTLSLCLAHATSTSHSHATDTDANTAGPESATSGPVAGEKDPQDRNPNPKESAVRHAFELFDASRREHVNRLVAAAERLRAQRRADEGRMLSDEEITQRVHRRQDVGWLAENDAEKVFRGVLAKRGCGDTKN